MKDEEFYIYCACKALEAVTLALQTVFTSMWAEKFPGTVFSIEELNKISKKKSPKQNTLKLGNADVKEWDISKLAYVMVEADALNLQATGTDITVAINGTKYWRNEILHKSQFSCDKNEFEICFGSFRNLVRVLESEHYKKYSDNEDCQSNLRKVDKFYRENKPVFWEKHRKMKSEYKTMKMDNMRYRIKEDCAKEKSIIECKVSELQEKNLELQNNIGEHVVEKSELQKELHKLKIENQNLVQKLSSETTEKVSLREKLLLNKKKRKQLQLKLNRKKMEIRRENIKRKNICKMLKKEEEKNILLQTKLNSITEENRALHVQMDFNTDKKNALQVENRTLRTENKTLLEKTEEIKCVLSKLNLNIKLLLTLGIAFMFFMGIIRINNEHAAETERNLKNSLLVMLFENNTLQGNAVMKLTWENTELKRTNRKLTLDKQKYLSENRYLTEEAEKMRGEITDLKKTAGAVKEVKEKLSKVTEDQSVIIQDNLLTIEQQNETIRELEVGHTYLGTQVELLTKQNAEQKLKEERMSEIVAELSQETENLNLNITRQAEATARLSKIEEKLNQTIAEQEKIILEKNLLLEEHDKTMKSQETTMEKYTDTISLLEREKLNNKYTIQNLNDALSQKISKVNDLTKKLDQKSRGIQGANDMSVGSNGHIQYDSTVNTLTVGKIDNLTMDIINCEGTNINIKGGITENIVVSG